MKSTENSNQYQPMVDRQSAQFIKISNPGSRIELIKQSGPQLFELLAKFKDQLLQQKQQLKLLNNYFLIKQSKWDSCMNKVKYYYWCKTCNQNDSTPICQQCFDKQYHKKHIYFTRSNHVECQCGLFSQFENKCDNHKYPEEPYWRIKDVTKQYQLFVAFITQFFTLFIQKKAIDHYYQIFSQLIDILIIFCKQSKDYCHAITYSLSLCPQNNNTPILKLLLEKNVNKHFFPNSTVELFKLLKNMAPFQILLLESLQKQLTYRSITNLDQMVNTLQKSPLLAIQLAKRNKLMFAREDLHSVGLYRTMLYDCYYKFKWNSLTPELMETNRKINLTPIFRLFMLKNGQNIKYIQNLLELPGISSFIMNHIGLHGNHDLLVDIVVYQLNKKVYKNNLNKQSDSAWYNSIIQAILYLYKGSIKQFPLFFESVNKQKLKQFICNYFQCLFKMRQKCNFNITTATCLIEAAKYYNIYQQIRQSGIQLDIDIKISCLQFSKNLSIVLRNLITGQHVLAELLRTIAAINHNKMELQKNNKIIIEWLRNYLHFNKQVNKNRIKQLKDSNRINFPEAIMLIQHQTIYNKQTKMFKYTGPSITCGQYYQFSHQRIPEQKKHSFFHTQNRYQILQLMLRDGLKHIQFSKFKSYPNQIKKEIFWNAALLLSIMGDGSKNHDQFAVQYLGKINQVSSGQRRKITFLQQIYQQQHKNQILIQKQEKMIECKDEKQNMMNQQAQLINPNEQINSENINKQQKIEEKMSNQQKKKCQKVLSAIETEVHRKRTNKIQRIKQKFNRKSNRYSDYLKSHEFGHQVCLICRETTSKNKEKSFLYYLASLKSDELTQLIYGLQGNQLNLATCFHPFHLKCLNNNNISSCTLCRINGNFILPVLDESPESQMFTRAWWDDFISMANFKPKPTNMYNYYNYNSYQNNATSNAKEHEQKKQAMQKLKARPYKNFIIIYRYLIMRLGSITAKTKWQDSIKKNHYFYQLIKFYYTGLNQNQREQLNSQIQCYQKVLNTSIMTHQAIQLFIVASQALTLKLQGLQTNIQKCLEIKDKCKQIVRKYQPSVIESFMKNIQWLLQSPLEMNSEKSARSVGLTLLDSSSITKIFAMSIPKTMQEVYSFRTKCQKCNMINGWLCIFCKKTGCISCDNASNHSKQSHNGNTILMLFLNQGKLTTATSSQIQSVHLYFDRLFINFDNYSLKCQQLKQYKYDSQILCQNVQKIFKKYF